MADAYTVADYIIDRLHALGVRHVFQVPGNYTAQFLGRAEASDKLRCVGTINELEAGYAADAYARLQGIGVACTTYGVGSFSLYNAIAGAFVERCPVVLLNGTAKAEKAKDLVEQGVLFAHAIDTLRTDERIFQPITAATAVVVDPEDAPRQIDRVLRACLTEKKPVYLEVRDGVWLQPCRTPANPDAGTPLEPTWPVSDLEVFKAILEKLGQKKSARPGDGPADEVPETEEVVVSSVDAAVERVLARLREAAAPILWGGEELQRYGLEAVFEELLGLTKLPYTTTLLGKSLIAETPPDDPSRRREQFIGVYDSAFAPADVQGAVENSDCVLALGTVLSEFYEPITVKTASKGSLILAAGGAVRVGGDVHPNVPLRLFVPWLVERLRGAGGLAGARHTPPTGFHALPPAWFRPGAAAGGPASSPPAHGGPAQAVLTWQEAFEVIQGALDASTFVLADTSVCLFPAAQLLIPARKHFIAQTAWLSIGYTVGAVVGVRTLLPDGERPLVLVGDGGFQMIAPALATLTKLRKPATVVVFDNALYAIEQFLVDREYFRPGSTRDAAPFCELDLRNPAGGGAKQHWDYEKLAEALGGEGRLVRTASEFAQALRYARELADRPLLIAVRIDPRTLPPALTPHAGAARASGPGAGGRVAPAAFN